MKKVTKIYVYNRKQVITKVRPVMKKKNEIQKVHDNAHLYHDRLAFDTGKFGEPLHLYQGCLLSSLVRLLIASYKENAFCQVYLSSPHFYDSVDLQPRKINFKQQNRVLYSSDTKLKIRGKWRINKFLSSLPSP